MASITKTNYKNSPNYKIEIDKFYRTDIFIIAPSDVVQPRIDVVFDGSPHTYIFNKVKEINFSGKIKIVTKPKTKGLKKEVVTYNFINGKPYGLYPNAAIRFSGMYSIFIDEHNQVCTSETGPAFLVGNRVYFINYKIEANEELAKLNREWMKIVHGNKVDFEVQSCNKNPLYAHKHNSHTRNLPDTAISKHRAQLTKYYNKQVSLYSAPDEAMIRFFEIEMS